MTAWGYQAYLLRVAPPHRPRTLQRLNSVGEAHVDLLAEMRSELGRLGQAFYRNEHRAEGFRIYSTDPHGRSEFIRLRRGPVGNPGETYEVESGQSIETTASTALLSELRAAVYIPEGSYYGFLFVERVGGRHAKDLIYQRVIVPIAKRLGMVIRLEGFAETADWRRELSGQTILRVSEVLKPTSSAQDASTPTPDVLVRVSAEGQGLTSHSEAIKTRIFDIFERHNAQYRTLADIAPLEARRQVWAEIKKRDGTTRREYRKAPRSAFTVEDAAELEALTLELTRLDDGSADDEVLRELRGVLPVDREAYQSRRMEVGLGTDHPEKHFVLEGDRVPQLVYPLGARLVDSELQGAWEASAERFLSGLAVSVSADWLLNRQNDQE
jgi:hypothetical protein